MPGKPTFFCSDLSRSASENVFGTASIGHVWLLVEYPYSWERKAVEQSALPDRVKQFLRDAVKRLPRARVLFIKAERPLVHTISFFVVRTSESAPMVVRFNLEEYDEIAELDIDSILKGVVPANGQVVNTPLFLVCTHGRRDKCCAKFGYPLFKALRQSTEESIWQSSHVGGDRFAANLVCLPHGLFYAHVTEESGRQIIDEYRNGRVALNHYRGRAAYSNPVQAAEYFLRCEAGITGIEELHYVTAVVIEENRWRVEFVHTATDATYETEVCVRLSDFQNFITCDGVREKPVPQFELNSCRSILNVG